jgi:DNA invertase Pin-like site-specific DNA recombinase
VYCRVSTDKQDTERQLRELNQFAENNNLNVIRVYEETMSGTKSLLGRRILLDEVKKHKPKYFVFHDYSRFSRNVKTALQMKDELHSIGVCLWSMQTNMKSLDEDGTPNPIANLVFTQLLSVYEMENETRRKHIRSGLRNAKAKGIVLGRPKGSTEDKLVKYKKIVATIKEQEQLKLNGQKYLSVRKTASYFEVYPSLIISIRKEMKERGIFSELETV